MPNYQGLTGDLELPEFEKPYRYDRSAIPCGVLFEESRGRRAVIDETSAAFAMICAMLWRMESDRLLDKHTSAIKRNEKSDLIAVGFHSAYEKCLAWENESAARLEAERKV